MSISINIRVGAGDHLMSKIRYNGATLNKGEIIDNLETIASRKIGKEKRNVKSLGVVTGLLFRPVVKIFINAIPNAF